MAGVKISNLPAIVTPAVGDVFPVVQSGVTYKESITQLGSLLLLLTGGTMTGSLLLNTNSPSVELQAASKGYVDSVATGLSVQPPVNVATTSNLNATYNNGTSGVGATLTNAGVMAALQIDGVSLSLTNRVLVKNQSTSSRNGIYTVTTVGSGAVNWVLTRSTDYDTAAEIQPGDYVLVLQGTVNQLTSYVQTATVAVVGTDAVIWNQFGTDVNALIASIQNQSYIYIGDSGVANAYVAVLQEAPAAYIEGLMVVVTIANTNTGASTLNVNSLGVKDITTMYNTPLLAGDLYAGLRAYMVYDGTRFRLINRNIEKRIQSQSFVYDTTAGSVNAYSASLIPSLTALVAGNRASLKINVTNTGASTLDISSLGATSIILENGNALVGGELYAGMMADFRYDGTNWQLLNPATLLSYVNDNIIIAGDFSMNPWQKGTTITAPDSITTADMFIFFKSGAGVVNILKTTDAPNVGSAGVFTSHCLEVDVTTADASIGAGDLYTVAYNVEGYDFAQIAQKIMTLSFWVKSNKTGTYCVAFRNSGSDRSYIAEYSISAANTWEKKVITVTASVGSGSWNYTNGVGLQIRFGLAIGSTYQTTANSWQAGNFMGTSNQVNCMDDTANTFRLALVKLEPGKIATGWKPEKRSDVLKKCQRYYIRRTSSAADDIFMSAGQDTTTAALATDYFGSMRIIPTFDWDQTDANWNVVSLGVFYNITDMFGTGTENGGFINVTTDIIVIGSASWLRSANSSAWIEWNASLIG